MRKGRFLKYLLAMVVAYSTSVDVMADEVEFLFGSSTVELKKQGTVPEVVPVSIPLENVVTASYLSFSSSGLTQTGNAVSNSASAKIKFQSNFKYEVNQVAIRRWTQWLRSFAGLTTTVKNISGETILSKTNELVDRNEPNYTKLFDGKAEAGLSEIEIQATNSPVILYGLKVNYTIPEIRIRFANGNKGYDVTVGDNNAQIEGYISAHPGAFEVGKDNVYFKYTSSNNAIAEIDPTTGKISAKAEGDTEIKATLIQKVGETEYDIASYDYPLHVFAPFEGLSWNSYDTWYKNSTSNNSSYKFGGEPHVNGIDWTISDKLKSQTTIWENESNTQSSGQYKQFASFEAPAPTTKYWRAAVQKLSCDILVPKYTKVESTMKFGANATLGSESKSNVTYGYELVDLGIKTDANTTFAAASAAATTRIGEITWNTASTKETESSVSAYRTSDRGNGITYLRNGANEYRKYNIFTGWNNGEGYVGDHYTAGAYWKYDNSKNAEPYNETRFFAAMVFLQNQVNYSATASFGYQDIPTYEYYVYLDYYANYDDNKHLGREERSVKAKDATIHLNSGNVSFVPNRTGYKLLGWSTDKDAKTAEFPVNGDFYPYDSENGGGKGPVTLYAVWQANRYKIILDKQNGQQNATFNVTYGQKISNVSVPTREGYAFRGYWTEAEYSQQTQESQATDNGEKYYNNKGETSVIWDRTEDLTLYAHWSRKTAITFDLQGGYDWATTSAIATNGEEMPGITTPQRGGHTFVGYYEQPDGKGIQYYRSNYGNAVSARIWDKDVDHATLYAHWEPKPLKLKFTYPSGEERLIEDNKYNSSKYSSLAGAKDKNGSPIEIPKKEGFLFEGWEKQGVLVYDGDGNAVEGAYWAKNSDGILVWNCTDDQTDLTARWIEAVEVATVSIQVIRDKNYENGNIHRYVGATISGVIDIADFKGDGYITVDGIHYLSCEAVPNGDDITDNLYSVKLEDAPIWHFEETTKQDAKTGLPAYNIYTVKDGQRLYLGNRVVKQPNGQVEIMYSSLGIQTSEPEGKFTIYDAGEGKGWVCFNENSQGDYNHVLYMQTNSEHYWELENSHNNSQYKPIKLLSAGHIISGDMSTEKIISSIKNELVSPGENNDYPYAYNVDGTPNINDEDLCKGLLYVDMSTIAKVVEKNRGDLSHFRDEASKNCLFFMPKSYNNDRSDNSQILADNVIRKLTNGFESVANLVITDKVPFSSPYTFSTGSHTASYSRETSDKWGSLCLPFPVKRSGSEMKFYNLYGSDDIRLAFKSDDGTNDIPANKPIACNGSGNFTLTSNSNAVVPADNDSREYNEVVTAISCENIRELVEDGKQMTTENKPWNFKGVRFDSYVYGTEYTETLPNCPNCAKKSLVYYFSKDKFTYVNSKGRVKFAPFRAYLQAPEGSSAKTFSLLVFDEDGATDITEIIDGNAGVANGKIYDLLGRRVKTPLKGHIYIVDGKKKQY